jgi:hypothetical protein
MKASLPNHTVSLYYFGARQEILKGFLDGRLLDPPEPSPHYSYKERKENDFFKKNKLFVNNLNRFPT